MTYLDTNILIYLMEGHPQYAQAVARELEKLAGQNGIFITSALTITEFLAGTASSNLITLQKLPRLRFVILNEILAEHAANLQRKHQGLQIGDAVHLATAIQEGAKLFFTNDKVLIKVVAEYIKVQSL